MLVVAVRSGCRHARPRTIEPVLGREPPLDVFDASPSPARTSAATWYGQPELPPTRWGAGLASTCAPEVSPPRSAASLSTPNVTPDSANRTATASTSVSANWCAPARPQPQQRTLRSQLPGRREARRPRRAKTLPVGEQQLVRHHSRVGRRHQLLDALHRSIGEPGEQRQHRPVRRRRSRGRRGPSTGQRSGHAPCSRGCGAGTGPGSQARASAGRPACG